jgi:type II secretory pathway pseudopilin PulG
MLPKSSKLLIVVLIAVSVVAAGLQASTISEQKHTQQDQQASEDLDDIHTKIDSYESSRGRLPKNLSSLSLSGKLKERSTKYTYKPSASSYKLCAVFHAEATADNPYSSYYADGSDAVNTYKHGKGETCFTYKTSSSLYDDYYNFGDPYSAEETSIQLGSTMTAADTERETDVRALHAQIEAYYATYGYYPSFSDLNTASWRSLNMKGLDNEALVDPDATTATLATGPVSGRYAYEPLGAGGKACNNTTVECTTYTLTATLSTGETFEKTAL